MFHQLTNILEQIFKDDYWNKKEAGMQILGIWQFSETMKFPHKMRGNNLI